MKNLFFIYLSLVLIFSCQDEKTQPDYIIVKGQLTNTKGGPLDIRNLSGFSKTINIKEDGSFVDTLDVNEGVYMGVLGQEYIPMYFTKGANIQITADAKDLSNTLTYSGDNSALNNYYAYKAKEIAKIRIDMAANLALEENDYLELMNTFKHNFKSKFEQIDNLDDGIKQKELRAIEFYIQDQLSSYEKYHGNVTKKENFQVSENFKSRLKEFDKFSYEDYAYSLDYNNSVFMNVMQQATALAAKDSIPRRYAELNVANNIENDTLRELVLRRFAEINLPFTRDSIRQAFYKRYMSLSKNADHKEKIKQLYDNLQKLESGNPSPKFVNYENYKGGTSSLDDFKGKYVYIDVWATWCGPCKAQIPFLKELETKYHGKNIEFVSISVDAQKDYQNWKEMIAEKEMGGVQLFADAAFNSTFIKDYNILGIPQFILLDPNSLIVKSNAPRPSDEDLVKLFDQLGI